MAQATLLTATTEPATSDSQAIAAGETAIIGIFGDIGATVAYLRKSTPGEPMQIQQLSATNTATRVVNDTGTSISVSVFKPRSAAAIGVYADEP